MTDESTTRPLPFPRPPRSDRPDDRNGAGTFPAALSTRAGWLVPAALILLSAIPLAAGAVRLDELAGGAEITPANARFFAAPLPVVLHIVCASLYCLLGAFQFAPGFRRRRPGWHRAAGRLLVPCGLLVAAFRAVDDPVLSPPGGRR